jgi:hypothetical protein
MINLFWRRRFLRLIEESHLLQFFIHIQSRGRSEKKCGLIFPGVVIEFFQRNGHRRKARQHMIATTKAKALMLMLF